MVGITDLTCDYKKEPIDIGTQRPLFGFCLKGKDAFSDDLEWNIQVADDNTFSAPVWDSGWRKDRHTVGIMYNGKALRSRTRYLWQVRVKESGHILCEYSSFETTLLHPEEWKASFIAQDTPVPRKADHVIELSKQFGLDDAAVYGRLYITALGLYRAFLNGKPVTDALLTPGFTTYHRNLLFQTYDVSQLLKKGVNELRVMLGYGWYGRLGEWPGQQPYAEKPAALLAQLEVRGETGGICTVVTDDSWRWRNTRIVSSNIYNGETVAGSAGQEARTVAVLSVDKSILHPHDGDLVRCEATMPARRLDTPNGKRVFDFGQNMSGFVRIRAVGRQGDTIRLRYAEVLDKDGNFYTGNLRGAQQAYAYTFDRDGEAVIEPQFTFFGFRYICVDQFPGEPSPENFMAIAIHSSMPQTLQFSCSDKRIEQLVKNTAWGMKSNFVDIPTDCPQRDERLGWTGDALAFCSTGAYFMRTPRFFEKWLHDMRENQYPDGAIPNTIPDMFNAYDQVGPGNRNCHSAAGWSEASLWCPYVQYLFFADKRILAENLDMMKAYAEYVKERCTDGLLWEGDEQFGDWLALDAQEGSYRGATPEDYVASAFHAYANRLLADVCAALQKDEEKVYRQRFEEIRQAFWKKYFSVSGALQIHTQTACVLALEFDLTPDAAQTAAMLAELIRENNGHLTTGFLGTPFLCQVLFDNGYAKESLDLLHQESYPSWLYPLSKGATTIWEHWDGIKPDGSMWSDDMNSFNHYAYGSICSFIFSRIAGLQYDKEHPGFEQFTLAPYFVPSWDSCSFIYRSVRGDIGVEWMRDSDSVRLTVTIPGGACAHLKLPGVQQDLYEGIYTYTINQ